MLRSKYSQGQLNNLAAPLTPRESHAKRNEMGAMVRSGNFDAAKFKELATQLTPAEMEKHDGTGFTPLGMAVLHRNKEATRILQEAGASLHTKNANGSTAALLLSEDPEKLVPTFVSDFGPLNAIQKMVSLQTNLHLSMDEEGKAKCEKDTGETVAQQDASYIMGMSCIKRIGADINTAVPQEHEMFGTTFNNLTVIQGNALNGQDKKLKAMLAVGADPNIQEPAMNRTALHLVFCATTKSNRDELFNCAKALVDSGADLSLKDRGGQQPLFQAARTAEGKSIRLLLDHGADVHATSDTGSTALHSAAYGGNPEAVKELIAAGADLTATNNSGRTALQMLELANNTDPEQRAQAKQLIIDAMKPKEAE